jgi:DNA-binding transcriptional ArsR family regulator
MSLTHVLGDVPATRILDFMLGHIEYDCTPKEVAEYADVATGAVRLNIARLVECGVVVETRKIGGVQLYTLDDTSVVTEALINLDRVISGDAPDPEDIDAIDADDAKKYPESEEVWAT